MKKIIILIFVLFLVFFSQANAQNKKVLIDLSNPFNESMKLVSSQQKPLSTIHNVKVINQYNTAFDLQKNRSSEISEEQLIIVGYDKQGKEITQIIIRDPRIIRAETSNPETGELTFHGLIYRDNANFSIIVPDSTIKIEIYSPRWNGQDFLLEYIGETDLPVTMEKVSPEPQPITKIVDNGPSNRIGVVFLGDGYVASEIPKYVNDVNTFLNGFFGEDPFYSYQNFYNVWRMDIVSNESGADHPSQGIYKDTALGAFFDCAGIERFICADNQRIYDVLNNLSLNQKNIVIIIVNDPQYGGGGGAYAIVSTHPSGIEIVRHEVGHVNFLGDEYVQDGLPCDTFEPLEPNVTKQTIRNLIKWNTGSGPPTGWIELTTPVPTYIDNINNIPGLYEGAQYCSNKYRPTYNSKMRWLGFPFYQINEEQLIKRIYDLVSPIDLVFPTEAFLTIERNKSQVFQVTTPSPITHQLEIKWYVDGSEIQNGNEFVFNTNNLNIGSHNIKVVVRDPTNKVRNDPELLLTESRNWTVNIVPGAFQYSITTAPSGLQINIDGTNYTSPQSFIWFEGSSHNISVSSPQSGTPGTRYIFSSWSDGGNQTHSIIAPSSSATYNVSFTTQYSLTTSVQPAEAGTVTPSGTNWYDSGQDISVSATSNPGYAFINWSGDLSGSINPSSVTMSGPKNVNAHFIQNYDFGNVKVKKSKSASFKVQNNGQVNLTITALISGSDSSMFKLTNRNKTIKPGKSATIKVTFKPTSTGPKQATLRITSNNATIREILLTGTGY